MVIKDRGDQGSLQDDRDVGRVEELDGVGSLLPDAFPSSFATDVNQVRTTESGVTTRCSQEDIVKVLLESAERISTFEVVEA